MNNLPVHVSKQTCYIVQVGGNFHRLSKSEAKILFIQLEKLLIEGGEI